MIVRGVRLILALVLTESLIFAPLVQAEQLSLPSGDLIAPVVTHEIAADKTTAGSSTQIKATVTDNVGVQSVTLFYRLIGEANYKRITMNRVEGSDIYMVTVGGSDIKEPGLEYYIQAMDLAGNTLLHGYSFSPLVMNVEPVKSLSPTGEAPATVASSSEQSPVESVTPMEQTQSSSGWSKKTWIWIGVGVLVAGAIAAAAGGSDGGGDTPAGTTQPQTGTVTINAPVPQSP